MIFQALDEPVSHDAKLGGSRVSIQPAVAEIASGIRYRQRAKRREDAVPCRDRREIDRHLVRSRDRAISTLR